MTPNGALCFEADGGQPLGLTGILPGLKKIQSETPVVAKVRMLQMDPMPWATGKEFMSIKIQHLFQRNRGFTVFICFDSSCY
jgi:hypothetical protein